MRAQPFHQPPLQRIGIIRYTSEQRGWQVCARVLDNLRHLLHQDRQAFAAVAQERGKAEASADERAHDDRRDQRDREHARSVAAESTHAQPRCQHVHQFVYQQAGKQCRQKMQLQGEAEHKRAQAPRDQVGTSHGVNDGGVHGTVRYSVCKRCGQTVLVMSCRQALVVPRQSLHIIIERRGTAERLFARVSYRRAERRVSCSIERAPDPSW